MFDIRHLRDLIAKYGTVARVVVASVKGSAPREAGTSMIVWAGGQSGTIGGGTLEFAATKTARSLLQGLETRVDRAALGPALNQCCGGAVTLVTEVFDAAKIASIDTNTTFTRRVEGSSELPGQISRSVARAAALDAQAPYHFAAGWLCEPVAVETTPVVIYGAGHVGLALAGVLNPLPEFDVTLADDRKELPNIPHLGLQDLNVVPTSTIEPKAHAIHLIMTHSHALDLDLCHRVLSGQFGGIGLIGSATKSARFRKRLQALGHSVDRINQINCPIGDPDLGKHPQAIALGVATDLLRMAKKPLMKREAC